MTDEILETLWKLRTDPFCPRRDSTGTEIRSKAVETTLDPLVDARVVPYYFDVYDWNAGNLIRGLSSRDGFEEFPTPKSLLNSSALLILISGSMQSGIDSLANLIVHKIRSLNLRAPLIVDVQLPCRDKARNVALAARRVIEKLRNLKHPEYQALVGEMQEAYDRVEQQEKGRRDATYVEAFQAYREILEATGMPVVLKIVEGGDNDSWVRIHESAKSFCSYVLVVTHDFVYAKTCYDAMTTLNRNVSWIRATPLDQNKAVQYLVHRLNAQRLPGSGLGSEALTPFSADSIPALYEPGATAKAHALVTYPVGWLRRTLARALDDKLAAIAAMDPTLRASASITGKDVRSARERLNMRM